MPRGEPCLVARIRSTDPVLRLTCLEDRTAPAVATWDGGGTTDGWSDPLNWVADVAPQSGDDLVFPAGAARLTAVNDFPLTVVMPFGQLRLSGNGYRITGGAISLAGGLTADLPFLGLPDSKIELPITLTADQTFTRTDFFSSRNLTLTGPLDLGSHTLTVKSPINLTLAGPIGGTGGLTVTGRGALVLSAANTFTGPTTVIGSGNDSPTIQVDGSIGNVNLSNATLIGSGTTGSVLASSSTVDPGDHLDINAGRMATLTVGNFTLDGGNLFIAQSLSAQDRIVVHGTVRLEGGPRLGYFAYDIFHTGETFTIIDNDGTDPVVGTFSDLDSFRDLPEGAIFLGGMRISYRGGDGNDVVVTKIATPYAAVAAGAGGGPVVNLYDIYGGFVRSFLAYDAAFTGAVRVALADLNGDRIKDVITAPGPGGGPHVKVFDGITGALIREWMAYDPAFRGGVFVATAPIDTADTVSDIVTGAGPGGGPHVQVFNGATGAVISNFMAYDPGFRGGVNVAALSRYTFFAVSGSGSRLFDFPGRVVTGPGPGGGPHVRIFEGTTGSLQNEFFAYDLACRGGVNVAAYLLDTNTLTATALIITGPGAGAPPEVRVFDHAEGSLRSRFLAYGADFRGGVTVSVIPESRPAILTGAGPGGGPHVRQWRFPPNFELTYMGFSLDRDFFAFDPAFRGGVFVG